jgi:hypothetical protein
VLCISYVGKRNLEGKKYMIFLQILFPDEEIYKN